MAEEYKLVPGQMPPKRRATVYARILEEFLAGRAASARVDMPRKPVTLYIGLNNARKTDPRYAAVTVHQRGDEIWLKKT